MYLRKVLFYLLPVFAALGVLSSKAFCIDGPANGGFNHYNQLFDREVIEASRRIDEELVEIDEEDGISLKAPMGKLNAIYQAGREFNDYHNMPSAQREISDEYHYQRSTGKSDKEALEAIAQAKAQEKEFTQKISPKQSKKKKIRAKKRVESVNGLDLSMDHAVAGQVIDDLYSFKGENQVDEAIFGAMEKEHSDTSAADEKSFFEDLTEGVKEFGKDLAKQAEGFASAAILGDGADLGVRSEFQSLSKKDLNQEFKSTLKGAEVVENVPILGYGVMGARQELEQTMGYKTQRQINQERAYAVAFLIGGKAFGKLAQQVGPLVSKQFQKGLSKLMPKPAYAMAGDVGFFQRMEHRFHQLEISESIGHTGPSGTGSTSFKNGTGGRTSMDALGLQQVDPVRVWEIKHGKKAVKNMTDQEFAQRIANTADRLTDALGPRAGQLKHKYAERVLNEYQKRTGQRLDLVAERRFKDGVKWEEKMGLKDSVKPDLFNKITKDAFDYKFGDAKVTNSQTQRYQQQLPMKDESTPASLTQIKPQPPKQ